MITGIEVIKMYELDYYLGCLIKYNQGNKNPYHNLFHTLSVVKNIYLISKTENIEDERLRLMLIAGIFHDFNHSGGKHKKDKYNILDAVTAYYQYTKELDEDSSFIVKMISITEYPFKEGELNIYQKIIRDADIMQLLEDNYLQQNVIGLNLELNNSGDITIEVLENNIKFMKSVEFFTDYTKHVMLHKLHRKLEECEYLIKILKEND